MNINLDNYETVKARKIRFYKDHPDGRIIVSLENQESILDFALFKAQVFLTAEDQLKGLPRGVGFALEMRDKEKQVSSKGKAYESVNFTSWTENCEESAVGRALDNAGYASNGKPSKEEMIKAGVNARIANQVVPSAPIDENDPVIPFGKLKGKKVSEVESSEAMGYADWLETESKKTGKPLSDTAKIVVTAIRKRYDIPF